MKFCILYKVNDLFIIVIKCRLVSLVFKWLQITYFYIFMQPKFLQKQIIWVISGLLCVCKHNYKRRNVCKAYGISQKFKTMHKITKNMLKKYYRKLNDFNPSAHTWKYRYAFKFV